MSDKAELLDLALRVGKKAAELLSVRPDILEVSTKSSDVDIVTQMDKASEALIVSGVFTLVLLCFLFFLPLFTGQAMTYEDWHLRMWFESWI